MTDVIDILGVKIRVTNLSSACQTIAEWISSRQKTYVCVAPVATIVDCQADSKYKDIVNDAGMTTPDGMPLVWLGKLKGHKTIQRTYGPDLMLTLCSHSEDTGHRHYFYGGTERTNGLLIKKLLEKFPRLNVAGYFAPPFRDVHERETIEVLEQINRAQPDVLWIGLGSPKQDYWMHDHRDRLNVPVMIGAGAAFDFLSGTKPQAPLWMRRCGLEWFFRLCCEPGRLWKRYLLGNSQFVYLLFKDHLKNRFKTYAS